MKDWVCELAAENVPNNQKMQLSTNDKVQMRILFKSNIRYARPSMKNAK